MPVIRLTTEIFAPKSRCFDLSRSIDLHKISTQHTEEEAIDGITTSLIGLNEWVTWRANHFGFTQKLTSMITEYDHPNFFCDEMTAGIFKRFRHEHHFDEINGRTIMIDRFDYASPLGLLGRFADIIIVKRYMTNLLLKRNNVIKEFAESQKWKEVLNHLQ